MHERIRPFTMVGIINDEVDMVGNKENMIHWQESYMRDEGYVPVLDMDPQYHHQYDAGNEEFNFTLTVYGAYVGEEEAWQVSGVMSGKKIMKSSPNPKSKES